MSQGTRRRVLAGISTTLAAGLAGCGFLGGSDSSAGGDGTGGGQTGNQSSESDDSSGSNGNTTNTVTETEIGAPDAVHSPLYQWTNPSAFIGAFQSPSDDDLGIKTAKSAQLRTGAVSTPDDLPAEVREMFGVTDSGIAVTTAVDGGEASVSFDGTDSVVETRVGAGVHIPDGTAEMFATLAERTEGSPTSLTSLDYVSVGGGKYLASTGDSLFETVELESEVANDFLTAVGNGVPFSQGNPYLEGMLATDIDPLISGSEVYAAARHTPDALQDATDGNSTPVIRQWDITELSGDSLTLVESSVTIGGGQSLSDSFAERWESAGVSPSSMTTTEGDLVDIVTAEFSASALSAILSKIEISD